MSLAIKPTYSTSSAATLVIEHREEELQSMADRLEKSHNQTPGPDGERGRLSLCSKVWIRREDKSERSILSLSVREAA